MEIKFVADNNVGKLARWLRLIGYDTLFFEQKDDAQMIKIALGGDRVILTKDAQFTKRRLVANGTLKTIHIEQDDPRLQVQEVGFCSKFVVPPISSSQLIMIVLEF